MKLGAVVRDIRLKNNIKQIDLARMAEISNTYLSDIEKGRTTPSVRTLVKIANALGVDDINIFLSNNYVDSEHTA